MMHPFFAKRKANNNLASGGVGVGDGPGQLKAAKMSSASASGEGCGGGAIRWSALHDSLLARTDPACVPNARIAAFDLDDTLQKTKSGKPGYMAQLGDFIFWSDEVAPKLRELHAQGYKIVIFTNQGGVKGALQGVRADVVRKRVDQFAAEVGVPLQAFAATQKGAQKDPKDYRKPLGGMWTYMARECNGGVKPDLTECYYVGDAAGRPGDHSDSDKAFAAAVGIDFYTPEQFFKEGVSRTTTTTTTNNKEKEKEKENGDEGKISVEEGGEGGSVIVLDDDDDEEEEFNRSGTP